MKTDVEIRSDQCKLTNEDLEQYYQRLPEAVTALVASCSREECFDHVSPMPLPSRREVIKLVTQARDILFPGYFLDARLDQVNLQYYLGQALTRFFRDLAMQITNAVRHEC
ncbi:MAG: serine acetyltransferase, partial [Desulfarculaceae bacterium]